MESDRRQRGERRSDVLQAKAQALCLTAALDHLPHPVLLLADGAELRIWLANAAALRELGCASPVRIEDGRLAGDGTPAARRFLRELRDAFREERGHARVVQLPLQAETPARGVYLERLDIGSDEGIEMPPLLLMEIPERVSHEQALQRLCGEFELTPKEAEIALRLYANGSVSELARLSGKSIHTVRAQLKSAMQKTNTRTQAALVALVSSRLGA